MARMGAFLLGSGEAGQIDRYAIVQAEADFQGLPDLSSGARRYLDNYDGDRAWLSMEARQLAQLRGSLLTGREYMVIVLKIAAGTWSIKYLRDGPEDDEEV